MTLKHSFSSALREDRKRRVWTFVLFALFCFLMTAFFELSLESYVNRQAEFKAIQNNIENLTRHGMISTYLVFAGLAACLYGFQGFGWLTKKQQVDFYHSQPVKREKRFLIIYLNGIIMCLVPMILHIIIYGFLIGIRGYLNAIVFKHLLMNFGIFLVAFLLMYHLVILAVMLTGNLIISFMVVATLFCYPSVVRFLMETYFFSYFDTYASGYSQGTNWLSYFSPVEQVYRAGNYFIVNNQTGELVKTILIIGIMLMIAGILAFYLYKKRPSEAAGKALAYPKAGDFIRFMIVIPAGMFFGIMFASFGVLTNVFWLIFGTVAGVILAHGFIEVIFQFDIKAVLKKKIQLAVSLLVVLGIVNIFFFDLLGYDTYIPKEEQVEEISYYIDIGEYNSSYIELNEDGIPLGVINVISEKGEQSAVAEKITADIVSVNSRTSYSSSYYNNHISREKHQFKVSTTKDAGPILDLVEGYMHQRSGEDASSRTMLICYRLKNGREVYRNYRIKIEVIMEYFRPIYDTDKGKEIIYPYWNLTGKMAKEANVYSPFLGTQNLELSEDEIMELVDCYKKDIAELTLKELLDSNYIGEVNLSYDRYSGTNSKDKIQLSLKVGDTYENLIRYLEGKDCRMKLPNEDITVLEIKLINPYDDVTTTNHSFWKGQQEVRLNREEIYMLLPNLTADEYGYRGYENNILVSAPTTVKYNQTGEIKQIYCLIEMDKLPEYMRIEQ